MQIKQDAKVRFFTRSVVHAIYNQDHEWWLDLLTRLKVDLAII